MLSRLIAAVIISALVVCAGAGTYFVWKSYPWIFFTSETVRIATSPANDRGEAFLTAFKQEIASEHVRLKLSLVETPSIWASAQAFKERKVDAAVVRSDDPAATGGRSILVLRTIYAAVLVPSPMAIAAISKLKGRKIGVLTGEFGIDPMAKVVLDFYGFDEKQIVRLGLNDLSDSLQHRLVAALLVIGPTGPGPIAGAIEAFRKVTKGRRNFSILSKRPQLAIVSRCMTRPRSAWARSAARRRCRRRK